MSPVVENCPTWLNELRGESPVLSASEWRLLVKIRSMAQEKFGVNTSSVDRGEMSQKLTCLIDKLKDLAHRLKMCENSRREFQEYYPQWRRIRDKNIKILNEIADEIQKKRKEANDEQYLGSFTSVVGGALSFAVRRHPIGFLVAAGIGILGSVCALSSSIAEKKLIEEKIKKVKATVDDDRQNFDIMWSWLVDSSDLQASVDQILDEMQKNVSQWKNAQKEIKSILSAAKERKEDLEMSIKKMLNSIKISPESRKEIGDVVIIIMAIFMLQKRYCSLFELASSGSKMKSQLLTCTRMLLSGLSVAPNFLGIKKSIVIVRMFLDLVNLIDLLSEMEKGFPSKECENVKKIATILEKEAYAFKRMYDDIQHMSCD